MESRSTRRTRQGTVRRGTRVVAPPCPAVLLLTRLTRSAGLSSDGPWLGPQGPGSNLGHRRGFRSGTPPRQAVPEDGPNLVRVLRREVPVHGLAQALGEVRPGLPAQELLRTRVVGHAVVGPGGHVRLRLDLGIVVGVEPL